MDEIRFRGWITYDDLTRVESFLFPRKIITSHTFVVVGVAATILMLICTTDSTWLFKCIFILILGSVVGGLMWLTQHSINKNKIKSYEDEQIIRSGVLSIDNVKITTDSATSEIKWDLFTRIEESENLIFCSKGKESYIAFAPYMFSSTAEWEQCKKMIKDKIATIQPGR